MTELKVSATNLSLLAIEDSCPKCWGTLARMNGKKPFVRPLPGIMQYHDKTQKWLIAELVKRDQKLPDCFQKFKDAVAIAPIGRVEYVNSELGIKIYGYPDICPENDRGGIYVFDNKSATFKGEDSPLYPAYCVQLNSYGYALEKGAHDRRVDGLSLVYWERPTDISKEDILAYFDGETLAVPLVPHLVPLEFDIDEYVLPHLERARDLLLSDTLPDGNPDCPDCKLLKAFLEVQLKMKNEDSLRYLTQRKVQQFFCRQRYLATCGLLEQVDSAESYDVPTGFLPYGVLNNWDFSE